MSNLKTVQFRKNLIVVFLIALMFTAACASFVKNAYNTLGTAGVIYDSSMKSVAELYKQGYIKEDEKEMVIDVAQKYYTTYQSAVVALEIYQQVDKSIRKQKELELQELLNSLNALGVQLNNLLLTFQKRMSHSLNIHTP